MADAFPQVNVLQHSLVQHHLSHLRDRATSPAAFRFHIRVLSGLLATEVTRHLELQPVTVFTPLEQTAGYVLKGRIAIVPILRAGLGMVDPLLELIPQAEVWHLGLYRDETTALPVHYYDKLPSVNPPETAIIVDPMLATGGSAASAMEALHRWGVARVSLLAVIATPEGIRRVTDEFPAVQVYTCAVDRCLNERKFILPGLGDAGDRIFHTAGDESESRRDSATE